MELQGHALFASKQGVNRVRNESEMGDHPKAYSRPGWDTDKISSYFGPRPARAVWCFLKIYRVQIFSMQFQVLE